MPILRSRDTHANFKSSAFPVTATIPRFDLVRPLDKVVARQHLLEAARYTRWDVEHQRARWQQAPKGRCNKKQK